MSETIGLTPENPIVIDRATWLRGPMVSDGSDDYYEGDSVLSTGSGRNVKRCCLGQICRAVDVPDTQLADRATPADLMGEFARFHEKKPIIEKLVINLMFSNYFTCSQAASLAMEINDDGDLTEQEREGQTAEALREAGIYITFSGPYAEWDERRGLTELS